MECEVCGKTISRVRKAIIDKVEMTVCDSCAKLGKEIRDSRPVELGKKHDYEIEEREVTPGFSFSIRQSRERMHLTQEEAAKRAGVSVSVLKRIETGKFIPDDNTARRLEKFFRVRIVKRTADDIMDLLDK
jgi:putative transcription factor